MKIHMTRPTILRPETSFYIGIDPGLTGAIAVIHNKAGLVLVQDMPVMANGKGTSKIKTQVNPAALYELLTNLGRRGVGSIYVALERVSSMPGQGVASMFSMGDTYGACRAVIACVGYPVEVITPQEWKKFYKIVKDENKEIARAKAIQLYPKFSVELARKKDHNRAEAILIAHFVRHILTTAPE